MTTEIGEQFEALKKERDRLLKEKAAAEKRFIGKGNGVHIQKDQGRFSITIKGNIEGAMIGDFSGQNRLNGFRSVSEIEQELKAVEKTISLAERMNKQ
ncbi:hypothetical protein [Desmospora activa]|uniref:Uncharacterized protein n=1 Tax=Desmospora activa DSM 45169 TaxID=1121389 RepID=A0A2T4YYY9_9BACL|nr:hypothetical protein [Desmospora activa]PTM51937.1 hypothetical protein C8J48_3761 [Desmospora activa DSM 45169]